MRMVEEIRIKNRKRKNAGRGGANGNTPNILFNSSSNKSRRSAIEDDNRSRDIKDDNKSRDIKDDRSRKSRSFNIKKV